MKTDGRGIFTRKYCDICRKERKLKSDREYASKRRQDPEYVRKHNIYSMAYYRGIMAPKGWFNNGV